jgi:hypothetical protein
VLFEELFLHVKKSAVMKQISDWIYLLHSSNTLKEKEKEDESEDNITRVTVENATWLFRNSLGNENLLAEKSVGKRIQYFKYANERPEKSWCNV